MKTISNDYKTIIKEIGREITASVSYTISGTSYTLGEEDLNNVSMHYEGGILKSVMKQLDLDSNTDIPIGTQITAQFGVKVNGSYEYINLGNYIVYSSEKQEDTSSYNITCYDKLLYSMVDYEDISLTYPLTIRNYIGVICTHLGLTFANASDTFPNYNREIQKELYLDEDGNSLGYTYRDVFDELAEVTASTICINNNDELELRYINDTQDTIDEEYFKNVNVKFGEVTPLINTITFKRSGDSDAVSLSQPTNLPDADKNEIVISDNQILNWNDRADYLSDILTQLYGLTYSLNDFSSTGITYYELCDKYTASIGGTNYTCIMFNDEINITQGLEENIHTDKPEESKTDYNTTSQDDRTRLRTELIVNKQEGTINILTSETNDLEGRVNSVEAQVTTTQATINIISENINTTNGDIERVTTTEGFTFDENGLNISKSSTGFNTLLNENGTYYKDGDTIISQTTKDNVITKDMVLYGKYYYGVDENLDVANFTKQDAMFVAQLYNDNNNEECFGHFYNGV